MIELDTIVKRNDINLISNEVGDELVIMDIESGNYIGLNNIGYSIWKLLAEPILVKDLIELLIEKYEVDKDQCTSDTIGYLNKMIDQKLILE